MNLNSTPTKETLFLFPKEFSNAVAIVKEVRSSVACDIAIGGSLAQRALDSEFAKSLSGKPLSDIDIVILGGTFKDCPILPSIKDHFYVTHINKMHDGYYFGMIHKKTGLWVDLFAVPYEKKYKKIRLGNEEYFATSIESQILHLAQDILFRVQTKAEVREKWVIKLGLLNSLKTIHEVDIEAEYLLHGDYFLESVPQDLRAALPHATDYVQYALIQGSKHSVSRTWSKKIAYPTDCITTNNGISIESKADFYRLFRLRIWDHFRKIFRMR